MSLARTEGGVPAVRLPRGATPRVAFEGRTPLVCPWRILSFGDRREKVLDQAVPQELLDTDHP